MQIKRVKKKSSQNKKSNCSIETYSKKKKILNLLKASEKSRLLKSLEIYDLKKKK